MERIAVGLDGSQTSETALRWAIGLAGGTGAAIVGINAFESPWSEMPPSEHDELVSERDDVVRNTWLAPAIEAGIKTDALVRDGDPREVLLDTALAAGAELLVLGRTGAGGSPGLLHLGSVVEHTLHHSTLPVAVIPPGSTGAVNRIVVGIDGSPESKFAFDWTADLARAMQAEVIAVRVLDPRSVWLSGASAEDWRREVERLVVTWSAPLSESQLTFIPVAQQEAPPADGLLAAAAARRADLLVVGTRGVGGFSGLRAGGVALKVLHRAELPLVLVPPA